MPADLPGRFGIAQADHHAASAGFEKLNREHRHRDASPLLTLYRNAPVADGPRRLDRLRQQQPEGGAGRKDFAYGKADQFGPGLYEEPFDAAGRGDQPAVAPEDQDAVVEFVEDPLDIAFQV